MKKLTMLISALLVISSLAIGQRTVNQSNTVVTNAQRCGTTQAMNAIRNQDPAAFDAKALQKEQQYKEWIEKHYDPTAKKAVITIPVVVQIWETTGAVPDSRVTEQLDRLNLDFRGTNPDRSNTPGVFQTADCEIEFCLTTKDEAGNPHTGIVRRTPGGSPPSSGGSEMWDPTRFLNIYVYGIGGGTLGFTYLSSQSPNQAVHIGTNYFGNTGGTYGMGRTATHEVGHWLNLEHIWGNGGCSSDDGVADTPIQNTSNGGCPNHPSASCSNGGDMFMNYMDYVNDACMFAFTPGQKARMQAALANDRPNLDASVCATPNLTAEFTASATTINAGQTVTFTDASTGPNTITSWTWDFDVTSAGGVSPGTAGTQGAHVVTYNNAGTYTVSLQVGDGSSTDTETKSSYIIVNPAGTQNCDSTLATWDLAAHGASTGTGTWGPDCNGTAPSGYILGQNCYNDNGWADRITYTGSGDYLTDVFFYFGSASGTGNFNYKVWGLTGALPDNGNVMAQQSAAISSVNTGGTATLWTLASPPVLSGDFFVGFDHTTLTNGDTVALMSAVTGSANTVYANETGGWINLSAYLTNGQSGAVVPVVCNNISTGEKEILADINEIMIFPNPSKGTINIALTAKDQVSVEVYSVVGELVQITKPINTQLVTLDVSDQPTGIYFVNIKTGNTVTTKKIMLTK